MQVAVSSSAAKASMILRTPVVGSLRSKPNPPGPGCDDSDASSGSAVCARLDVGVDVVPWVGAGVDEPPHDAATVRANRTVRRTRIASILPGISHHAVPEPAGFVLRSRVIQPVESPINERHSKSFPCAMKSEKGTNLAAGAFSVSERIWAVHRSIAASLMTYPARMSCSGGQCG